MRAYCHHCENLTYEKLDCKSVLESLAVFNDPDNRFQINQSFLFAGHFLSFNTGECPGSVKIIF